RVIFTFTDEGGLKEMTWTYPNGIISLGGETTAAGYLFTSNSGDPYKYQRKWEGVPGEESDVYRSNVITYSDFQAIGGESDGTIANHEWEIAIVDMHTNITTRKLVLRITNEGSRIGSID
nr:hypothetical protein [Bacteroidota bacterium]